MSFRTKCAECDEEGDSAGDYDHEACIGGTIYGPCHDCGPDGGICESIGRCTCTCHPYDDGTLVQSYVDRIPPPVTP